MLCPKGVISSTPRSRSSFETLGVSIAESHFDMTSSRAGVIVATSGSIGVISLLSMGHLAKFLSDIQLICGGMLVMACGVLSLGFLEQDAVNPSWKFCTAIFLIYSVGYPIGHTAVIGLFSKSFDDRPDNPSILALVVELHIEAIACHPPRASSDLVFFLCNSASLRPEAVERRAMTWSV